MAEKLIQWGPQWLSESEAARWEEAGFKNPTPKPEVQSAKPTLVAELPNLEMVPARRLKADVMEVYQKLGGASYLLEIAQKDPNLFYKLLLKILPQSLEQDVRLEAIVSNDLTAVSTAELKALILRRLSADASDAYVLSESNGIDCDSETTQS